MNLAQQALESCDGFLKELDVLQGKMIEYCKPDKIEALREQFCTVRLRASAIKGLVTPACVCAEPPHDHTLRATQAKMVSPFPEHVTEPPPPGYVEAANR